MKIVPRAEIRDQWNAFCDAHESAWWWWRCEWLDYLTVYAENNIDHSFGFMLDGVLVGICPLIQQEHSFRAGGDPLPWPLHLRSYGLAAERHGLMEYQRIMEGRNVTDAAYRLSPLAVGSGQAPEYPEGYKDISYTSSVLDLTPPLDMLWQGVSKGHSAAIHRGLRELDIGLRDSVDAFHSLHVQQAGRETRTQATWDLMQSWNVQAIGWLWSAVNDDCRVVGSAYFLTYKRKAYYASAAYVEDNVAHAVIWTAIRQLRQMGITELELGSTNGYAGQFKAGFGGEDRLVWAVEWRRP